MRRSIRLLFKATLLFFAIWCTSVLAENPIEVPILAYHNFNPTVPGSMSITPEKFETQLKWLKENGYTVIPLKNLVSYLLGQNISLPAKPVVITADDGWASVYTYMLPLVRKYNIPVTLFIYPGTISHGRHAMTWDQLKQLQQTGLFDIQGHTYEHPNFKQGKKRLSTDAYEKLVHHELFDSKKILEEKLGTKITLLAWPFGIYNDSLEQQAANAGYTMAFSIDARHTAKSKKPMAQPRYMIVAGQSMKTFAAIVQGQAQGKKHESSQKLSGGSS
ncbi:polysaccharide deacetylase family protein [soil metagenome]